MRMRGWWRGAAAVLAALILVLPARVGAAAPLLQEAGDSSESRTEVILITVGVVLAALLLCAVGYMYRRALGLRRVPPVTLLEPGQKITSD